MFKKIIILVAFAFLTVSVKAQMVSMEYEDESGNSAVVTMSATGLAVCYGDLNVFLPATGINASGMVYSNGLIGATLDITGQNLCLFDSKMRFDFTFKRTLASVPLEQGDNGGRKKGSIVGSKTCSLCHGKGWIGGHKSPTYGMGGSYYCSECGREVSASHSHDRCPSCAGKGTTPTINY